jgi:MFS family permease
MASSAAAYVLARFLAWPSRRSARVAGIAVAVGVSCVPIALVRNELKQYTGDAFFALGLFAAARWVDRDQRPCSVMWLGAAAVVAYPFSTTSAFVSAACFGGVLSSALLARKRARVIATFAVGTVVAIGLLAVLTVTVLSHINGALEKYWRLSYLSGGTVQALQQTWNRLQHQEHALAMPALVGIVLFVVGILTLARMRETALAVAVPLLWIEMFVAASLRRYPFLDQRTFYFVLIPSIGVIVVGVVGVVFEISRRVPVAGVTTGVLVTVLFGLGAAPFWQKLGLPTKEDSRAQTQYVASTLGPSDIVLVSSSANWGFAYYWPRGHVLTRRSAVVATGFLAEVGDIDAVYASDRTRAAVLAALRAALDRQHHNGPRSRVYIVRSHVTVSERDEWTHAFAVLHVHPRSICVGPEPLLIIEPVTPTLATPDHATQNAAEKIEPCPPGAT